MMPAAVITAGIILVLASYLRWGVMPVLMAYEIGKRTERIRSHLRADPPESR